MNYGIVLKEKEFIEGLTKTDAMDLLDHMMNETDFFPIEIEARMQECSAMGFITLKAAEILDYDYKTSGLHDFISTILDNMSDKSEDCEYEFKGIKILLSR